MALALPVVGGERGDERRQIRGVLLYMMKLTGVTDEGKKGVSTADELWRDALRCAFARCWIARD